MPSPSGCDSDEKDAGVTTDVEPDIGDEIAIVVDVAELDWATSWLNSVEALVMTTSDSLPFAALKAADSPSHTGQSTFLVWIS